MIETTQRQQKTHNQEIPINTSLLGKEKLMMKDLADFGIEIYLKCNQKTKGWEASLENSFVSEPDSSFTKPLERGETPDIALQNLAIRLGGTVLLVTNQENQVYVKLPKVIRI